MRYNYLLTGAIQFFQFNQYKLFSNIPTERRVLLINSSISKKDLMIHHSNMYLLSSPNQSLVKEFYKAIIYCIFHSMRSGFFSRYFSTTDGYMMSSTNILIVAKLAVALSIEVHVQNYTKLQNPSKGVVLYNICLILLDILYCTS
jgi:hypothetical protein